MLSWGPETGIRTRYFLGERLRTPQEVRSVIDRALNEASNSSQTPMGIHLITPLTRLPDLNSPLGEAVAEAILTTSGAELAIQNRGGVRSDLPQGSVNHRQLYSVLPFANRITLLEISVADLRIMLEHMANRRNKLLPYLAVHEVRRKDGKLGFLDVRRSNEGLSSQSPSMITLPRGRTSVTTSLRGRVS